VIERTSSAGRVAIAFRIASLTFFGLATVREVEQQHEAGGALDEGSDRGAVVLADDEVALQMAGNGAVGDFGRTLGDPHHVRDLPATLEPPLRAALGPARSQAAGELSAQLTAALDEEGLVDCLVAHVHRLVVGELDPETSGDLLGRPPLLEPHGDLRAERAGEELRGLRTTSACIRSMVRPHCSVVGTFANCLHLTRDGRRRPAEPSGDSAERLTDRQPMADLLTIRERQA
jgi:hypothetical protein